MTFNITKFNSIHYAYKKHSYQIYKPKQGDHNKRILEKIFTVTESMLSHYSRVFVVRVDLHVDKFTADNKLLSKFLGPYNKKLKCQCKCRVGHIVVREQNTSNKQHYHLALFLHGEKINHPSKLLRKLSVAWKEYCNGSIALVENSYYMMHRGDKSSIDPVIYRLSYLAKTFSKEKNTGARDYLCSQIQYKDACYKEVDNDILLVNPQITLLRHQQQELVNTQVILAICDCSPLQKVKRGLDSFFVVRCHHASRLLDWFRYRGYLFLSVGSNLINQLPFYKIRYCRRQKNRGINIMDSS